MTGPNRGESMDLNEAILRGLHQLTDWGILTTDTDLVITGWNRWLEVNGGRPAGEVIGRNLLEVFPDLVKRRLDRFYRQALGGGLVVLSQGLHKYLLPLPTTESSGAPHMQQSVRIAPVLDEGVVVGTLTLIEDVSERVTHEAELRARARQQTAVAVLSQRALAGEDLRALMEQTVELAVKTLGAEYGEILEVLPEGRGFIPRAAAGLATPAASRAPVEGGAGTQADYVCRADGPVLIESLGDETRFRPEPSLLAAGVVSGLAVKVVEGGCPLGVFGVYMVEWRPFTADHGAFLEALSNVLAMAASRMRLEEELRKRAEALAAADQRKDEFLAMLAHELRNPLAPLRNATQVLRSPDASEAQSLWARDLIDRQLQQMARLIDDLMDVSRITQGKINFQTRPLELGAVLARAIESSQPLIDVKRHQLTVAQPDEPIHVAGDAARLAQALGNLLNNAAKYTREGGRIWLTAERVGGEAAVRVRDSGVGIPAEMLPRVFDLFTQLDRSLDRSEGGLGIGLTLVRKLVELHGGRVEVFSAGPDQGSEFVVRLPILAQALPASPAPAPVAQEGPPSPPRRVLVVDDNVDARESLALLLRLNEHDVQTALDGPTALKMARTFLPEVVLLDIGLPGMNGYEVARHLRKQPETEKTFLVALTGYGQEGDRRQSRDAGFNAHMVKPVDLDALTKLLADELAAPA